MSEMLSKTIETWYHAHTGASGMSDISKPTLEKWAGRALALESALAASQAQVKEWEDRAQKAGLDWKQWGKLLIAEEEKNAALQAQVEALERASQSGARGEWQRCPVCDGRGDHVRGFYDGPGPVSSDATTRVVCRTCRGLAVICRPGVAALATALEALEGRS